MSEPTIHYVALTLEEAAEIMQEYLNTVSYFDPDIDPDDPPPLPENLIPEGEW